MSKDVNRQNQVFDVKIWLRALIRVILALILPTLLLIAYITKIEPYWLKVSHIDVPVENLPEGLEGFTIVQLSDIHFGLKPGERLLPEAVDLSNRVQPDMVVLTGDFVDGRSREDVTRDAERVAEGLAELQSRWGVYAVLGNHDIWDNGDIVAEELQDNGISVLRNERIGVEVGGTRVWVIGIEDAGYHKCRSIPEFQEVYAGHVGIIQELLGDVAPDEPRVMLVHNPDLVTLLPDERVDVLLSGHTHGGYAQLPVFGTIDTPSCYGEQWTAGLVKSGDTWVYVNRGLGGLAMRFNSRPEVSILRLVSP